MTTQISYQDFTSTLNSSYGVVLSESSTLDLKLVEVSTLKDQDLFESFTLLFEATEGERLVQNTYTLKHSDLGANEIFLVPVILEGGTDKNCHYYGASFSRKKVPDS